MASTALQIDALWGGLNDPDTGQSYSNAIVAFFEAGTTTPKAVWLDKDKTLPSAAGLTQTTLNSNGVAKVFGDGSYKINIYDPEDNGLTTPLSGSIDGAEYIITVDPQGVGYDSIADMRAGSGGASDGVAADLLGYYTQGDGGGGQFYWDATSTETDNGGTIIKVTAITTGRWLRSYSDPINIRWFGVIPSQTDNVTAMQALIDNFPSTAFYAPAGAYTFLTGIQIKTFGTKLRGDGKNLTVFNFDPASTGTFLTVASSGMISMGEDEIPTGGTGTAYVELSGFNIQGSNSIVKTAIKCVGTQYLNIDDVRVLNWGGTRSIGLHTKGHEMNSFSNMMLFADIPLLIDVGPTQGGIAIDADHFTFKNMQYVSTGGTGLYPNILWNAYAKVTNLSFIGYQTAALGEEWINQTTTGFTNTGRSGSNAVLTIEQVRTEQGVDNAKYSISLENFSNVHIKSAYLDASRPGVYMRSTSATSGLLLDNYRYEGVLEAINVDETVVRLQWDNAFLQSGSSIDVGTMRRRYASRASTFNLPSSAIYSAEYTKTTTEEYPKNDGTEINDLILYGWSGSIAAGAVSPNFTIAAGRFFEITVITLGDTSKVIQGGKVIDAVDANVASTPFKLSGTTNFDVGVVAGNVTYNRVAGNTSIFTIRNDTADDRDVRISVKELQ